MPDKNWKERLGMVYSTNPEYNYNYEATTESDTLDNEKQRLVVSIDKKGRAGKQVTAIDGFIGKKEDLEILSKMLKTKCGVGGTAKDGRILIQGDHRDKIVNILNSLEYKAKRGN